MLTCATTVWPNLVCFFRDFFIVTFKNMKYIRPWIFAYLKYLLHMTLKMYFRYIFNIFKCDDKEIAKKADQIWSNCCCACQHFDFLCIIHFRGLPVSESPLPFNSKLFSRKSWFSFSMSDKIPSKNTYTNRITVFLSTILYVLHYAYLKTEVIL